MLLNALNALQLLATCCLGGLQQHLHTLNESQCCWVCQQAGFVSAVGLTSCCGSKSGVVVRRQRHSGVVLRDTVSCLILTKNHFCITMSAGGIVE